jgi:hypothetical protein
VLGADLAVGGSMAAIVDARGAWLLRADGARVMLVEGEVRGACFDATGRSVLVYTAQDLATIHAVQDGSRVGACMWNPRGGPSGAEKAVALGSGWAIYCSNNMLRFHDDRGGELHKATRVPEVEALKTTKDRRILPVGRSGRALRLLGPGVDEAVWPRVQPHHPLVAADIDPLGRMLCAIASDNTLLLSDMRDGGPWMERQLDGAAASACALSHDGTKLLVGHVDGLVRVLACDPAPAALQRLPRAFDEWELQREGELAAPLEFTPLLPRRP